MENHGFSVNNNNYYFYKSTRELMNFGKYYQMLYIRGLETETTDGYSGSILPKFKTF